MPIPAELSDSNSPTRNEIADHENLYQQYSITNPLLLRHSPDRTRHNRPQPPLQTKTPSRWSVGEYAKSIVYGGMDAIVTCFSLISSVSSAGGKLSSTDMMVLGFANLVADGISMGFGDYVSSKTERDLSQKQRDLTENEVEREVVADTDSANKSGKMEKALIKWFVQLGMDEEDASTVVKIFSKNKKLMVEQTLLAQQKGSPLPLDDETEKPWKNGLVTFIAFLIFGSAPLLSFMLLIPLTHDNSLRFAGACFFSLLALALLGLAKAKLAGENYWLSAFMTVSNGAIAAAVAYTVGWTLRNVAGLEDAAT